MSLSIAPYSPTFVTQLIQENEQLRIENALLKKQQEATSNELLKVQLQLNKFAQMVFGKKGERYIANLGQLALDLPADTIAPSCKLSDAKEITYTKSKQNGKRELGELGAYMKDLPHVYETKNPDFIPDGAVKIGEEKHETLEYTPGKAYVKVVVMPRYKVTSATEADKTLIIAAPAPERPLFKCLAGSSFLANILVDKYCDHYFNGFFFNKIPLIKKLKLREVITAKILYGGVRNENNPTYNNSQIKFSQDLETGLKKHLYIRRHPLCRSKRRRS